MIEATDVIELAPAVVMRDGILVVDVRGVEVPLNPSARVALETAGTISDVAAALERLGAREPLRDAVTFARQLNALLLVNVRAPLRDRVLRRLHALRYGIVLQAPARRLEVGTPVSFVCALTPTALAILLLLLPPALLAGAWVCAGAFAAASGVVVHEGAHAVALRGVPRALVFDGLKPSILHAPVGAVRTLAAAVAGPLVPALAAVVCVLTWRAAAMACVPLAAHALGLTVAAPDGRNACGLS
jgi:hypothetical protein